MAKKYAGSGLLFMHLQLAFQRDGVQGLYDVLCDEINIISWVIKMYDHAELLFILHITIHIKGTLTFLI